MGGVGDFLFGKKPKPGESESGNHAYDEINSAFKPAFGYTTGSGNMLSGLLGLNGNGAAQTGALNNFADSAGMGFLRDQGTRQINSSQAAKGLLHSGSTLKALDKYGQGLGSTYLNQYMDNLFKLGNMGISAGSLVANAGQYSKGQTATQGKQGALPTIIQAASMIPGISDPRLKFNIVEVGQAADGLKVYEYELFNKPGLKVKGVMSNEVKELRPWAYIPNYLGSFDGVHYGKLGSLR